MPTCVVHFHKQISVVVSASLIGQSSSSFITVSHKFKQLLLHYQRQGVFFFITISNSVWSPQLLIGQSGLSVFTVLDTFGQNLFYYQGQVVVTSLSLCFKRKNYVAVSIIL